MDPTSEQLRQLVLPLFAVTKTAAWHAIGTTFVISAQGRQALLATAGHNVEFFRQLVLPQRRAHASTPGFLAPRSPARLELDGAELVVLVRTRGSFEIAVVGHASMIEGIDLAVLTVELPADSPCRFERAFALDTTPTMPIGQRLLAIGYSGLNATSEQDFDQQRFTARIDEGSLVARPGKVLANAQAGGSERFTGVYVSCPFDSGMSGGPVVELRNEEPFVRAVITSDLSENAANHASGSGARAFASSIWMLAGLRAYGVRMERRDGTFATDPLVRDLLAENRVRDVGSAHVYAQLTEHHDGGEPAVRDLTWRGPTTQQPPTGACTVPQASQIQFTNKEVLELLLKSQGIHEGHWILGVNFTWNATNIGVNGGDPLPTAVVQVAAIVASRVAGPTRDSVDATVVNPAFPPAETTPRGG
jgi:hypothetical protein